ncbi:MAG TPA: metallophosphoesterase family protein [Gemmatimonadaceae bacterium]|nr:metallophosphoesterase family protein [Gemmatimonadaceae bacterium]
MKCPVGPASIRTKSGSSHIPPPTSAIHRLGLISDTHGLVRPEVHSALAGVDFILHAGDVGGDEILDELALIAPVHAVYGNTDEPGNPRLHAAIDLTIGGLRIHVSHGHELGVPKPEKLLARYAADVIVYGHTHKQLITRADNRLVINPGAAGPARFDLEPSVAILEMKDGTADARIIGLPMRST